jgi:hypothetical protein
MMKLFAITIVALVVASSANVVEEGKHLFILSGQSNMACLKPELSFTPAVEKAFGKDNVIVVKSALGGQPIYRWNKKAKQAPGYTQKPGDLYDVLMKAVNTANDGKKIKTVTFVWMQGERDAKIGQAHLYAENFKGVLEQLRTDLKTQNLNVVIGRISDHMAGKNPEWDKVRTIQVELAKSLPSAAWVDTDDLNDGKDQQGKVAKNALHYTEDGYKTLGQRFADKAIELINAKPGKPDTVSR